MSSAPEAPEEQSESGSPQRPSQPPYGLISTSTERVRRNLGSSPVTTSQIVQSFASLHPEYGKSRLGMLSLSNAGRSMPVDGWLTLVRGLFTQEVPELHGRAIIVGLALLDESLSDQLSSNGLLMAIVGELSPSDFIPRYLSAEANRLWEERTLYGGSIAGAVPVYQDVPATIDALGRASFADAIVRRLRYLYGTNLANSDTNKDSLMVHLHGPWGSGKTTLLTMIARRLREPGADWNGTPQDSWIVVDLNAWAWQRVGPPWWWLMQAVYRGARRDLKPKNSGRAFRLLVSEGWWRMTSSGWVAGLLAVCGVYATIRLLSPSNTPLDSAAKPIADLLALVMSGVGIALALQKTLIFGNAKGAEAFLELKKNPTRTLSHRFEQMLREIGAPVAVLIDDLDRCQPSYVVDLLEGIQTMFRDSRIVYIVASDRRWIQTSLQSAYSGFADSLSHPGRPFGNLFMDKLFQVSARVPELSDARRELYWRQLVLGESMDGSAASPTPADRAEILALGNEEDILAKVSGAPEADKARLAAAAVDVLSRPARQRQTQHLLLQFSALLESNPRAMKRLVNEYSLRRDMNLLAGVNVELSTLARWLVLEQRWPSLAEYLAEQAFRSGAQGPLLLVGLPGELKSLENDVDVRNVLLRNGTSVFDMNAARRCMGVEGGAG